MRAAIMIMNHKKPNDYIISSNQQIKIINIIKYIFFKLKLNIKKHLKINKKLIFRKSNNLLVGNNNFVKTELKWRRKYNYKQMINHILKKKHG